MIEKQLSDTEKEQLRRIYCNDELFRYCSRAFWGLFRCADFSIVEAWHNTELIRQRVQNSAHPEYEIQNTFDELEHDYEKIHDGRRVRTFAVLSTFFLLIIQLANARDYNGTNINRPLCRAVAERLKHPRLIAFSHIMRAAMDRTDRDFSGEPIVFVPSNYLETKSNNIVADSPNNEVLTQILSHTTSLKNELNISQEVFNEIWTEICSNNDLAVKLSKISPRKNDWNINAKMVCNIIGVMMNMKIFSSSIDKVNSLISAKNWRQYISNSVNYGTSNTELTEESKNIIEKIIADKIG